MGVSAGTGAIVGGGIGALGSIIAGSDAANATTTASNNATNAQLAALQQQATLAQPYTNLGQSAIPTYEALLGIPSTAVPGIGPGGSTSLTPSYIPPSALQGIPKWILDKAGPGPMTVGKYQELSKAYPQYFKGANAALGQFPTASGSASIQNTLANLPGYQFALGQGLQAGKNQLTSMGLGKSGNAVEGATSFATGLAQGNYQQYLQDLLAPVQIGQGAAAGQAANIGAGATNLGNIAIGQGNTLAGINANEIAGITKAIGSGMDNYTLGNTLAGLGNPNYGAPAGWFTGGQTGDLNYQQQVAAGF